MAEKTFQSLPVTRINIIVYTVLAFYPLVGMGMDLIAPSLPAIARNLNISTNFAKNLISIYFLGYALGNFFNGFLTDTWGRRNLLISGFAMFVLASLLPIFLPQPTSLLIARFIQGFTMGAYAVVSRGIFSDLLTHEQLLRVAATLSAAWGIGPIIGPVIGGYLQHYYNWQACFYFYSAVGFLALLSSIFIIPETNKNLQPLNIAVITNNLIMIIKHRIFLGSIILMGIMYSILIVFNTLGPFLIQNYLGYSTIAFGKIGLGIGVSYLLGSLTCRFIIKYTTAENIFVKVIPYCFFIIATAIICSVIAGKNIYVIVIPSYLLTYLAGIVYPAAIGKGLSLFRNLAGSSSAIMNLVNILIITLISLSMSFINATSGLSIAIVYLILMIVYVICYFCCFT